MVEGSLISSQRSLLQQSTTLSPSSAFLTGPLGPRYNNTLLDQLRANPTVQFHREAIDQIAVGLDIWEESNTTNENAHLLRSQALPALVRRTRLYSAQQRTAGKTGRPDVVNRQARGYQFHGLKLIAKLQLLRQDIMEKEETTNGEYEVDMTQYFKMLSSDVDKTIF
jgi:hypothetical protein